MTTRLPEQIYLQAHDTEGHLLDAAQNEVTWCVDRINENDGIYILATPELVTLLERLAKYADTWGDWDACNDDTGAALALAARIREALEVTG